MRSPRESWQQREYAPEPNSGTLQHAGLGKMRFKQQKKLKVMAALANIKA